MNDAELTPQTSMPETVSTDAVTRDLSGAVAQLRTLVCGLGAALIVVSTALSAFVFKQNSSLSAASRVREQQFSGLQQSQRIMDAALGELYLYAKTNSDLNAIFERYALTATVTGGR
jgi:hypothetical protein